MTKISIIVPVYNAEKHLAKCLETLTSQTLKDIEVIIVNDGSTDNSDKIINQYKNKDKRIKYFYKKNGGQASARNMGLKHAVGEYVSFIDSDDYVELDMCEKMYNIAISKNYDIIVADYFLTTEKDIYKKVLVDKNSGEITISEFLFSEVCPWNKLFKKEFLIKNKFAFPEGIILEDYASIPGLVKHTPKIYYFSSPFVHYVLTENSTMRSEVYKPKYEDIFKASEILYNSLKETKCQTELEFLISYHMLYFGSLNFYKFKKTDQIDKISNFIKIRFPKWYKNRYIKKLSLKKRVLMRLFYYKKYKIINFFQKVKRSF